MDETIRTNGRHETGIQNLVEELEPKRPLGKSSEGERILLRRDVNLILFSTRTSGCSL
jgi:hypothetical protein